MASNIHYGSIGVGPEGGNFRWMIEMDPDGLESFEMRYEEFDTKTKSWEMKSEINLGSIENLERILMAARRLKEWDKLSSCPIPPVHTHRPEDL